MTPIVIERAKRFMLANVFVIAALVLAAQGVDALHELTNPTPQFARTPGCTTHFTSYGRPHPAVAAPRPYMVATWPSIPERHLSYDPTHARSRVNDVPWPSSINAMREPCGLEDKYAATLAGARRASLGAQLQTPYPVPGGFPTGDWLSIGHDPLPTQLLSAGEFMGHSSEKYIPGTPTSKLDWASHGFPGDGYP